MYNLNHKVFDDSFGKGKGKMKVIAINGSPRKNWNTATLLQYALEGAASQGAETKLYHLIDYDFKGCRSCFACKKLGGKSYGKCAAKDGLTPILEEIDKEADAFILGSPIYIGGVTAEMRALIERLLYPYAKYDKAMTNLFSRRIPVGFIYTMNWTPELLKFMNVGLQFAEGSLEKTFGPLEKLCCYDTLQVNDYAEYDITLFDVDAKKKRREEQFPVDCRSAYDMGVRMVQYYKK